MTPDTPAPLNAGEREERVRAGHAEIARLSQGGRWIMSIPARPRYDSDLILDDALTVLEADRDALAERVERVKALADEWAALGDTDVAWWWSSLADRLRAALDVSPEPDETGGGR